MEDVGLQIILDSLEKHLKDAGFPQVPVVSLNAAGLEKNPGFKFTYPMIKKSINVLSIWRFAYESTLQG